MAQRNSSNLLKEAVQKDSNEMNLKTNIADSLSPSQFAFETKSALSKATIGARENVAVSARHDGFYPKNPRRDHCILVQREKQIRVQPQNSQEDAVSFKGVERENCLDMANRHPDTELLENDCGKVEKLVSIKDKSLNSAGRNKADRRSTFSFPNIREDYLNFIRSHVPRLEERLRQEIAEMTLDEANSHIWQALSEGDFTSTSRRDVTKESEQQEFIG
eukprot:TRINITY_DN620_c0_g1_i3.p1 TRINITY_DN620_c0_g1~~TRINITY_DN620_c0_g1_i3.p1  ORF type:complete len:219 (-),score=31.94 TRINITY_DN620_c0_g1_i3:222-878(-)